MTLAPHEAAVQAAFNAQVARFKASVAPDDVRLCAVLRAFGDMTGLRVLDLGCGKGRFAARLVERGARVIGLDVSSAMLGQARGLARVRGTARRLPFAAGSFDGVVAIEVFEHFSAAGLDDALAELKRVLRPGGLLAVVDKNAGALDATRPWLPSLAVKWIDECRGRWMYDRHSAARERWFWPQALRARLAGLFDSPRVEHLLMPAEECGLVFRALPAARLMTLWTARAPGGGGRDG